MNIIKDIARLNQSQHPDTSTSASWHHQYRHSAYIYVGGLPFTLTEGDLITVCSQWGEVVDVVLMRDRKTGASRGFGWLGYADQRSTVLAVDNGNGMELLGRTIRVDHVANFKTLHYGKDADPLEVLGMERERKARVMPPYLMPASWKAEGGGWRGDAKPEDESTRSSHGHQDDPPEMKSKPQEELSEADRLDPMRDYLERESEDRQAKRGRRRRRRRQRERDDENKQE